MKKAARGRAMFAILLIAGNAAAYGAASSCVACHTNPTVMKAMVSQPAANAAEAGEG